MVSRPLFEVFPRLQENVSLAPLGEFPTPVSSLAGVASALGSSTELWAKRDDVSSPVYGGNKVRTLEILFGQAKAEGATRIHSTGAFGTNHGLATVLHAPRAGLEPGLILFPQPESDCALENLRVMLSRRPATRALLHWSSLPFGMSSVARADRREGRRSVIMVPGGATPLGALGYVSAALELAQQVEEGALPAPDTIVIGVGSTCTSAGLLVGLWHAARLGIGLRGAAGKPRVPKLVSVRVTPWPVTSRYLILKLAVEASQLLARLGGDASLALDRRTLGANFEVTGRYLGSGYGLATDSGRRAITLWREHAGWALDTTYSAKAAAAVIDLARRNAPGPVLFWSTKSSLPLPAVKAAELEWAPARMRKWMQRAERVTER